MIFNEQLTFLCCATLKISVALFCFVFNLLFPELTIPDCILDYSLIFFQKFLTKDGLFKHCYAQVICVEGSKKTSTSGSALNQLANWIGISLLGPDSFSPKATFTLSANVLHQPLKRHS